MRERDYPESALFRTPQLTNEHVLREFSFAGQKENQLVFFFKPECFVPESCDRPEKLLDLTMSLFEEFEVELCGTVFLHGSRLNELKIIDRHYGFIAELSRDASRCLTPDVKGQLFETLAVSPDAEVRVLGGHEFLADYPEYTPRTLNDLWLSKESQKIRSGFYYQLYELADTRVILVNGFFPQLLEHYVAPDRGIAIMLLESDRDWSALKEELVGDTFPERASANSIRGRLYHEKTSFGIRRMSISNNFVHLSAGPFEALFEIENCLKDLEISYSLCDTRMYHLLAAAGIADQEVRQCLSNPTVIRDREKASLFSLTESMNSREAIREYLKWR